MNKPDNNDVDEETLAEEEHIRLQEEAEEDAEIDRQIEEDEIAARVEAEEMACKRCGGSPEDCTCPEGHL